MKSIDHVPILSQPETDHDLTTLHHRAVPLDLSRDPEVAAAYWRRSLIRIGAKVDAAFEAARAEGWVEDETTFMRLKTLVLNSLCDSQTVRIERNRKIDLESIVDMQDERVERAGKGVASSLDLLSLLEDYPALGSIELAKLSHPLDADAARDMDIDVIQAIRGRKRELALQAARYKRKSDDPATPAAVVLRKQVISDYSLGPAHLQVVRRQALLVRGDEEVLNGELNPFFDRMVKNPDRFSELAQKVDGYYSHNVPWLCPIASTYYAKISQT